jgi:hypothetical protein
VSLLSPHTERRPPTASNGSWVKDIGLDELIDAFGASRRYIPFIRQTLEGLETDISVIAWRQAVFADFMRNSQLVDQIETLLSKLATLKEPRTLLGGTRRSLLLETSDRLAELDVYIDIIQTLSVTLSQSILESTALTTLRDNLLKVCEDENYQFLRDQLPALRQPLESIASLTIGVNLDLQLQPTSVVLLEVNDYRFAESASFLDRLIGISDNNSESGIAPVHYTPREADLRPFSPLFKDLDRLM